MPKRKSKLRAGAVSVSPTSTQQLLKKRQEQEAAKIKELIEARQVQLISENEQMR
jgi:hypothetical protein